MHAACLQHNTETYWVRSRIHKLTIFALIMTGMGIVMTLLELMFLKGVCELKQNQSRIMDLQDTEPLGGSELDQGLHRANQLQSNHPDVGQAQLLHLISPTHVSGCPGFKPDPNSGSRLIIPREVTSVDFSSTVESCPSWTQGFVTNMWNRNEPWIKGRIWGSKDLI